MRRACREHTLDALLADELPPEEARRVRTHAARCAACTHALAWLRVERQWVAQRARGMPARAALRARELQARLGRAAGERGPASPGGEAWAHPGRMALAAAVALALVLFSLAQQTPAPSAPEQPGDGGLPWQPSVCVDGWQEALAALEARLGVCLQASPARGAQGDLAARP